MTSKFISIGAPVVAILTLPTGVGVYTLSNGCHSSLLEESLKNPVEIPDVWNSDPDVLSPIYKEFFAQYAPEIRAAAQTANIEPELIAGIIVEENERRSAFEDIVKDSAGMLWNKLLGFQTGFYVNLSLGPGQVNIDTAAELDRKYSQINLATEENKRDLSKIADALYNSPDANIQYTALYISELRSQPNRQSAITNIFDDPHRVAILGTEYVSGPRETALENAVPSCQGAYFALYLSNTPVRRTLGEDVVTITDNQRKTLRSFGKCSIAALCDATSTQTISDQVKYAEYEQCLE